MRVLMVAHYTRPHTGGIEMLVDALGRRLARDGHEVAVVSSRAAGAAHERQGRFSVTRVAAWNVLEEWLHVPYPLFAPTLLPVLWREARAAHVVHAHGVLYLSSLCALACAWWMAKPLVVTEHVGFVAYRSAVLNAIQRLALALLTPLFLRRADAVIALNAGVHGWLARRTPHPERLHFVPNGVDTERFRPPTAAQRAAARRELGIAADRAVALFVGRFVEKKRIDLLLGDPDDRFDLVLCGRGSTGVAAAGGHVQVLGEVDPERMPIVYRAADVFLLPSRGEGFSLAVMEAMASGLPVVAAGDATYDHYVSGREMVQTHADGQSLRGAALQLFADPLAHAARSRAARARAVADFSLETCAARHLAIYERARTRRALSTELTPFGYDLAARVKAPNLRALLGDAPPAPWLDVGPGNGWVTHAAFNDGPVVVVDLSHANLASLMARARRARASSRFLPVCADLTALPFADGRFGTVLCAQTLEHVADDGTGASELLRVLAPAGRLILEIPNLARGYSSYLQRLGVTTVHDVPGPEFHFRPGYTIAGLEQILAQRGGRIADRRGSVGPLALLLIDLVASAHLLYERWWLRRSAWTWADVDRLTHNRLFAVYGAFFPFLRLLARLDRIASPDRGFILAARVEKTHRESDGSC